MAFSNQSGKSIVTDLICCIQQNKDHLSQIDGLIGDGDHGINMNKGFSVCGERVAGQDMNFTGALYTLGNVLFSEIGGSMGPLYGTLFMDMAEAAESAEVITQTLFGKMLHAACEGVQDLAGAKPGDKTLVDALQPADEAFNNATKNGKPFKDALQAMKAAAETGRDETIGMIAKLGRAARLGERSRGVPDAGATSCALLLCSMADSILKLLKN